MITTYNHVEHGSGSIIENLKGEIVFDNAGNWELGDCSGDLRYDFGAKINRKLRRADDTGDGANEWLTNNGWTETGIEVLLEEE